MKRRSMKYFFNILAVALAIVLSAFGRTSQMYTYVYQGPVEDLHNELKKPVNWVLDGQSPFECEGGSDVTCSFMTEFNITEIGKNHLRLGVEIILTGVTYVDFIIVDYVPVLVQPTLANIDDY
jgi:hypothetical protein